MNDTPNAIGCAVTIFYVGVIGTGWRRLIGSPKLQIIFHKKATKYRSLLQKMTYKDKGSYESSPPCTLIGTANCILVEPIAFGVSFDLLVQPVAMTLQMQRPVLLQDSS